MDLSASLGDSVIATEQGDLYFGSKTVAVGRDIVVGEFRHRNVISEDQAFERIGAAVRLNLDQLERNASQARAESNQFFRLTLVFAAISFVVVAVGVIFLFIGQITAGVVSAIASIIPEATAALFFRKDRELRRTIELYHQNTLGSQRILTMIDVAETINDPKERDRIKREIIMKVLCIDVGSGPENAFNKKPLETASNTQATPDD